MRAGIRIENGIMEQNCNENLETDKCKYIISRLVKALKLCKAGQILFKVNGYRVSIIGDYVKIMLGPFLLGIISMYW